MVGMPINLNIPAENKVATYSWTDIASGAGYATFYPFSLYDGSTTAYYLSDTKFYGYTTSIGGSVAATAGWTKVFDVDFDVTINSPRIINGNVTFFIPIRAGAQNTNGSGSCYLIAKLRVYRGGSEIDVGSVQSPTFSPAAGSSVNYEYHRGAYIIPITNYLLKKDDILRVTFEGWATRSTYGTEYIDIAFSPNNEAVAAFMPSLPTTTLSINIPFKIE